jgi:hypothetical protein
MWGGGMKCHIDKMQLLAVLYTYADELVTWMADKADSVAQIAYW